MAYHPSASFQPNFYQYPVPASAAIHGTANANALPQPFLVPMPMPVFQPTISQPLTFLPIGSPDDPNPRKKRLLKKWTPEELKLEQARLIALRKEKEAREAEEANEAAEAQHPNETLSNPCGSSTALETVDETGEEAQLLREAEKKQKEEERQLRHEQVNKYFEEERLRILNQKTQHILNVIRAEGLTFDRFFESVMTPMNKQQSSWLTRELNQHGVDMIESMQSQRPKLFESWIEEKAVGLYGAERKKLNKKLRPEQKKALKAVFGHLKQWNVEDDLQKHAPGMWGVMKKLENLNQPDEVPAVPAPQAEDGSDGVE